MNPTNPMYDGATDTAPANPPQISQQPQLPADPTSTPSAALPSTPAEAADTDMIEPEWISKVKQVVFENKDNPYKQVMALNQLKADYLKKRYNKDLKLPGN